jgi:hypothetical protein
MRGKTNRNYDRCILLYLLVGALAGLGLRTDAQTPEPVNVSITDNASPPQSRSTFCLGEVAKFKASVQCSEPSLTNLRYTWSGDVSGSSQEISVQLNTEGNNLLAKVDVVGDTADGTNVYHGYGEASFIVLNVSISGKSKAVFYCGGTPPTVNLTANVNGATPSTGTFQWSVPIGDDKLQIVSGGSSSTAAVSGTAPSATEGDVTVQVDYSLGGATCSAVKAMTVQKPTSIGCASYGQVVTYSGPNQWGHLRDNLHQVRDQFPQPKAVEFVMPWTEVVTEVTNPCPITISARGDFTDAAGMIHDTLGVVDSQGPLDPDCFQTIVSQAISVAGCPVSPTNTIFHGATQSTTSLCE